MHFWIGVRLAWTTVWLGALAVAGAASELARPPYPSGIAAAAPGSAWLPWLGVGAVGVLVGLGFLWWRNRRMERQLTRRSLEFSFGEERYRTLFDNTPVQILEEDFTAVEEACARLRAEGVTNRHEPLEARPNLQRELRGLVQLRDANRPAIAAAGFAGKPEMIARFPQHDVAPYPEVFDYQLEALGINRQHLEEEFRYLDANGQERACLMLCRVNERDGQPDLSRVTLVLLDITTAKRTVTAQMENQELMRQILAPRQHPAVVGPGAARRRPHPVEDQCSLSVLRQSPCSNWRPRGIGAGCGRSTTPRTCPKPPGGPNRLCSTTAPVTGRSFACSPRKASRTG